MATEQWFAGKQIAIGVIYGRQMFCRYVVELGTIREFTQANIIDHITTELLKLKLW
jgi:hypothetical protein